MKTMLGRPEATRRGPEAACTATRTRIRGRRTIRRAIRMSHQPLERSVRCLSLQTSMREKGADPVRGEQAGQGGQPNTDQHGQSRTNTDSQGRSSPSVLVRASPCSSVFVLTLRPGVVPPLVERRELLQPQRLERLEVVPRVVAGPVGRREGVEDLDLERLRPVLVPILLEGPGAKAPEPELPAPPV